MKKPLIPKTAPKCRKCPYKLGTVKCIVDPCPECMSSGRKTHPFDVTEQKTCSVPDRKVGSFVYERSVHMSIFDDLKKVKSPNIPTKTLGGEICWDIIRKNKHYRLQRHQLTHHCRILNSENIRIANGSEQSMIAEFERLNRRESAGLGIKPTNHNIKMKTLGGVAFWEQLQSSKGYALQQHKLTHHCRILDNNDNRIAYGREAEMREVFKDLKSGKTNAAVLNGISIENHHSTLGGIVFWEDIAVENGYRIQENVVFKNCRILDTRNICIASGSKATMRAKLNELNKIESKIRIPAYGDIIGVERAGGIYDHYGVYVDDSCVIQFSSKNGDFGNPVIHKTTLSDFIGGSKKVFYLVFPDTYGIPGKVYFSPKVSTANKVKGSILTTLAHFAASINSDAENYLDYVTEALDTAKHYHNYSPEETVRRAKSCLGKTNFGDGKGEYALHRNNCEHFAIWCKTGLRQSVQAEGGFMRAFRAMDML